MFAACKMRKRKVLVTGEVHSEVNPCSLLIITSAHQLCLLLQIFLQAKLLLVEGLQRCLQLLQLRRTTEHVD